MVTGISNSQPQKKVNFRGKSSPEETFFKGIENVNNQTAARKQIMAMLNDKQFGDLNKLNLALEYANNTGDAELVKAVNDKIARVVKARTSAGMSTAVGSANHVTNSEINNAVTSSQLEALKDKVMEYGTAGQKEKFMKKYNKLFHEDKPVKEASKQVKGMIDKLHAKYGALDNETLKDVFAENALGAKNKKGERLFKNEDIEAGYKYITDSIKKPNYKDFEQQIGRCRTAKDIERLRKALKKASDADLDSEAIKKYDKLLDERTFTLRKARESKGVSEAATGAAEKGKGVVEKVAEEGKKLGDEAGKAARKITTLGWFGIGAAALLAIIAGISVHNKNKQKNQLNTVA